MSMYFVRKLLLVSDLESNKLHLVKNVLNTINTSIDEITLHYSYQIPLTPQNVIITHDKIKLKANNELNKQAKKISEETGIKTYVKLSLGSKKRTLQHILNHNKFDYVVSDIVNFDSSLANNYLETNFLNNPFKIII